MPLAPYLSGSRHGQTAECQRADGEWIHVREEKKTSEVWQLTTLPASTPTKLMQVYVLKGLPSEERVRLLREVTS